MESSRLLLSPQVLAAPGERGGGLAHLGPLPGQYGAVLSILGSERLLDFKSQLFCLLAVTLGELFNLGSSVFPSKNGNSLHLEM